MKKILPILIVVFSFGLFLAIQVFFDSNPHASFFSRDNSRDEYLNNVLNDLKLTTHKGKIYNLKKKIPKIVILNFWASWCTPCIEEFPSLISLIDKFDGENLKVFAINTDDSSMEKAILKTEKLVGKTLNFDIIKDSGDLASKFRITSIPSTIIFIDGKLHSIHNGKTNFVEDKLVETIKANL